MEEINYNTQTYSELRELYMLWKSGAAIQHCIVGREERWNNHQKYINVGESNSFWLTELGTEYESPRYYRDRKKECMIKFRIKP
jgi:hypothetical protein